MSLDRKVTLIVILVFLLSGLLSLGVQHMFITPSFLALERDEANKNAERALEAIRREIDQISPSVSDWAHWTDTHQYAKGERPQYVADNLEDMGTLQGIKINYLGIYDALGRAVWTQGLDLGSNKTVDLGELTSSKLDKNHPLLKHPSLVSEVKGIISTLHAPMLVVAKPILTNESRGPAVGALVMGRFLDATAIERLSDQIKLPLTISLASQPVAVDWVGSSRYGLAHSEISLDEQPEMWQARTTIADLFGQPLLALQVDTSREISAHGAVAVRTSLLLLAATAMFTMFVLWLLLRRAVLQPISQLTEHAIRIGDDDNHNSRLELDRQDEVGILARTFDEMIDRLAETRRQLIDQSFHSGIAEMASGVLHNIGNALTPLTVRMSTLSRDLGAAPVAEIEQAAIERADPSTPEERRRDLTQFIELAGVELAALVRRSREEIAVAAHQVAHVQEILVDQARFSHSARVIEPVNMETVIRQVVIGLSPETKPAIHIDVTSSVAEIGAVAGSRVTFQQVVTNLLVNAAESIQLAGMDVGQVTITAVQEEDHGQHMIHLRFTDNGVGIHPDHIGRLFERGFSTKGRGSGLGLHWSANTILALGGQISAESPGPGQGACFHLWLPLAQSIRSQTDVQTSRS